MEHEQDDRDAGPQRDADDETLDDSTEEEPRVLALRREGSAWTIDRRSLMAAGLAAAAGCRSPDEPASEVPDAADLRLAAEARARELREGDPASDEDPDDPEAASKKSDEHPSCSLERAHLKGIEHLACSRDGRWLTSQAPGEPIKIWSLPDGALRGKLSGSERLAPQLLVAAASNDTVYTVQGRTAQAWNLAELESAGDLSLASESAITALVETPDGRLLVLGNETGELLLFDREGGSVFASFRTDHGEVAALSVSAGGELLAVGYEDGSAELRYLPDGNLAANCALPVGAKSEAPGDRAVQALAISPTSRHLAIQRTASLELWDIQSDRSLFRSASERDTQLAWFPGAALLASAGADHEIRLWSPDSEAVVRSLDGHAMRVTSIVTSAQGFLVSASLDQTIRVWSLPDAEPLLCLIDLDCVTSEVEAVQVRERHEGREIIYTLPCGSPTPPGATCICDCVPGTLPIPKVPKNHARQVTRTYCSCDTVCTCNTVCSCVSNVQTRPGSHYWYPN